MEGVKDKWGAFRHGVESFFKAVTRITDGIGNFFGLIFSYLYRIHKAILAAPVVIEAARLAQYNFEHLPEQVGLDLQATGEYAVLVSRDTAVLAPLVVTGACLILMFCSRRTIYPWLISIFSLALPVLILIINMYPA